MAHEYGEPSARDAARARLFRRRPGFGVTIVIVPLLLALLPPLLVAAVRPELYERPETLGVLGALCGFIAVGTHRLWRTRAISAEVARTERDRGP